MSQLPETGFLRLAQIIGQDEITKEQAAANRLAGKYPRRPRPAIPAVIPIKKTAWWEGIKSGRYPKPTTTLGLRVAAWRVEDIRKLCEGDGAAPTCSVSKAARRSRDVSITSAQELAPA